mgnify:FL=1
MKKLDKKLLISAALLILILIFSTLILGSNLPENPKRIFSHTKAICTEKNYCQDYHISCENDTVISISPITRAAVQFPEDWTDPRDEKTINNMC